MSPGAQGAIGGLRVLLIRSWLLSHVQYKHSLDLTKGSTRGVRL